MRETLKGYDKITIIGHDNIDVDSFISGILLSRLLSFMGIKNEFIVLEEVKEDDTYLIIKEIFGVDMNVYYCKEEVPSRKLFLEDHYKTTHLGEVVACLDHHPTCEKIEYSFYRSRVACSTSYMIYELMQEVGYPISNEDAKMILVSMMIDTVCFRNTKTVKVEAEKAKEIAKQYRLDYKEMERYCLCLTPIGNDVPINTIINNGYKYYNYNGRKIKSSYVQVYKKPENKNIMKWTKEIQKILEKEELVMWVFIIFECEKNITYEYHITSDGIKKIESKGILSRGTTIMPRIEKTFL